MQAKGTKINSNPRLAQDSCSRPARVQASPSPGSTPCCAAAAGQSSSGGAGAGGGVCKGSGGSSSSSHPEAMHYSGCGMWSALTHALAHHGHGHSHGHDAPKQSPTHRAAGYSWLLHKLAPHLLDEHHAKQPSHKGGMEQTAACPQPASALDRSSSLSTSYAAPPSIMDSGEMCDARLLVETEGGLAMPLYQSPSTSSRARVSGTSGTWGPSSSVTCTSYASTATTGSSCATSSSSAYTVSCAGSSSGSPMANQPGGLPQGNLALYLLLRGEGHGGMARSTLSIPSQVPHQQLAGLVTNLSKPHSAPTLSSNTPFAVAHQGPPAHMMAPQSSSQVAMHGYGHRNSMDAASRWAQAQQQCYHSAPPVLRSGGRMGLCSFHSSIHMRWPGQLEVLVEEEGEGLDAPGRKRSQLPGEAVEGGVVPQSTSAPCDVVPFSEGLALCAAATARLEETEQEEGGLQACRGGHQGHAACMQDEEEVEEEEVQQPARPWSAMQQLESAQCHCLMVPNAAQPWLPFLLDPQAEAAAAAGQAEASAAAAAAEEVEAAEEDTGLEVILGPLDTSSLGTGSGHYRSGHSMASMALSTAFAALTGSFTSEGLVELLEACSMPVEEQEPIASIAVAAAAFGSVTAVDGCDS